MCFTGNGESVPRPTLLVTASSHLRPTAFLPSFTSSRATHDNPHLRPFANQAVHHATFESNNNDNEPSPTTKFTAKSTTNSSNNNNKVAILFLHGLGDSAEGWSSLSSVLPQYKPSLTTVDITYVFPPAHMVGITVNGGEQMPGWFDVFDWPIGIDAKDDPKGLALSVKRVEQIVDQLKEEEGIDPSNIVIGGFSQGGAVALMAAYNRRKKDAIPFAGCCVLSGWLPMKDYLDVSEQTARSTPLFWAHGEKDDKILFEQQILGVKKLKSVGVDVIAKSYPVGHESANFEEIEDMAEFIEGVFGLNEKKASVKWANEDYHHYDEGDLTDDDVDGAMSKEDELNSVLYYLCALGMDSAELNNSIAR
ncbi:hypothetical protein ACHAXN_000838 [Cyclotella atomus]